MKNLLFVLLIIGSVAMAHEYEFRDSDGFVQATGESSEYGIVIRDTDGFETLTIDSDGAVRNTDGFAVGDVD